MDESTIRGMKLLELEDRKSTTDVDSELKDREERDKIIRAFGVHVRGYDPCLRGDELMKALKSHFSSCGEIDYVTIPRNELFYSHKNSSSIHITGQDIEKKVMELNGSDMGGWKIVVELPKMLPPRGCKRPISYLEESGSSVIYVKGFDFHLPEKEIERAVIKHFSSCGEILETILFYTKVRVLIKGEGAVEKALNLRKCQCGVEGCKLVAEKRIPGKKKPHLLNRGSVGFTPDWLKAQWPKE